MTMKYDSDGFLIGDEAAPGGGPVEVLHDIKDGVDHVASAIEALSKSMGAMSRASVPRARQTYIQAAAGSVASANRSRSVEPFSRAYSMASEPRARDALGRFVSMAKSGAAAPASRGSAAVNTQAAAITKAMAGDAASRTRDAMGRFGAGGKASSPGGRGESGGSWGARIDRLKSAIGGIDTSAVNSNMDPAMEAAKEVSDKLAPAARLAGKAASVIGRGAWGAGRSILGSFGSGSGASDTLMAAQPGGRGSLASGGSRREPFVFGRILRALMGMRSDEKKADALQAKRLKEIAEKADGGGPGTSGLAGKIGAALMAAFAPILAMLAAAINGPLALARGVAGMLSGLLGRTALGAAIRAGASGLGGGGGGKGRRFGALSKGLGVAGLALAGFNIHSAMTEGDDPALTAEQNKAARNNRVGSAVGSSIGGIVGAAIGAIGGPLGMMVGGAIGAQIGGLLGEKFGEPVTRMADSITRSAGEAFGSLSDFAKGAWTSITESAPVKAAAAAAQSALSYVKESAPVKAAAAAAQSALSYVKESAPVKAAASLAKRALGFISGAFESRGDAGAVSSGKGDLGGASYGKHQLASNGGGLQAFLKQSGYDKAFEGMKPGSAAFGERWRNLAKNDPKFSEAQEQFVKSTYYDKAMAGMKKGGLDLSSRGSAVQEAIYSTSVQFGAGANGSRQGAVGMFQAALAGKDISKMSDAQITDAIQQYKIDNNEALFKSSSKSVRDAQIKRALSEKSSLAAHAAGRGSAEPAASSASSAPAATVAQPSASPRTESPGGIAALLAEATGPAAALGGLGSIGALSAAINSVAMPSAPGLPSGTPGKIPDAPDSSLPAIPSNSQSQGPLEVFTRQPVSQDVSDRSIAHVVTGGMGAVGY